MENNKGDLWNLISLLKRVILFFIILVLLITGGFIWYLSSIDSSHTYIDSAGVYNLVDSEGNIISTDLTSEDISKIMELLNGED